MEEYKMDGKADVLIKWITEAKKIKVPFFQRPYVWNDSNFDALIESFIDAPDNTMPFLGSVIMKKIGDDEYLVIDGQQRITTFSILIRVLLDLDSVTTGKKMSDTLRSTLKNAIYDIEADYGDKEIFTLRLEPSNSDKDSFEKIMDPELNRPIDLDSLSDNNLIERAYAYFYNFFKADEDIAKLFALKLYYHDSKSMLFIVLDDKDDEQKIFDSVNSLGTALSNSDIIKNYIFQKIKEKSNNDVYKISNMMKLYNNSWNKVFYEDDKKDFWYKKFTIGRISTDHLECFLRDFAVIKGLYAAKKTTGQHGLCNAYKDYIKGLSYESICDFVKEIQEYAEVYYDYKNEYSNNSNYIWSDSKNRILLILDFLETSTFNPYLLKLFKENDKNIEQKLFNFERFILYRFLYGGTTKNYNQCCEGLIRASDDLKFYDEYLKESPVTNASYKTKLRELTNKQGRLIMFLIEMLQRNGQEDNYSDVLNINAYTLEHVMPQNWEKNEDWLNVDSYTEDGTLIDKNDKQNYRDNRNMAVYSLGNFALLTSKLNSAVSNGAFAIKINGNGKKNGAGMRKFAAALFTTSKIINTYDTSQTWDERNIYANEKEYFNQLNDFYHFE